MASSKRFIVSLSDEHRAKLEALRQKLGLRSEADVVRFFADHGADLLGASNVGIVGPGDSVRSVIAGADLEPGGIVSIKGDVAHPVFGRGGLGAAYRDYKRAQRKNVSTAPTPSEPTSAKGSAKRPKGQPETERALKTLLGPVGTDGQPLPARKPMQKGAKK